MKKIFFILLSVLVICIAGCSQSTESQKEENDSNPILDRIYMHNTFSDTFDFNYVKFYDDNTFQGIEVIMNSESKSHHGTYAIDGNALTLNISDKTYAGVILDAGASIEFGDDEFLDWTSRIKDTDPLLEKFK